MNARKLANRWVFNKAFLQERYLSYSNLEYISEESFLQNIVNDRIEETGSIDCDKNYNGYSLWRSYLSFEYCSYYVITPWNVFEHLCDASADIDSSYILDYLKDVDRELENRIG